MPEFLIERKMPGVGDLDVSDLKRVSRLSWVTQRERFPSIHWLQSYATDDILYCVYRAPSEEVVREYAKGSSLPVHKVCRVRATIDPFTIEDDDGLRAAARQRMLEHARFCRHMAKTTEGEAKRLWLDTAEICEGGAARAAG